jgi:hypothetical protein
MGIVINYLTFLPMVFNSSMAIEGTKKRNVPFNEADLDGIVLNSVPVSWMDQCNCKKPFSLEGVLTLTSL